MIFIITGKPGAGKTTWIMSLFNLLNREFIQVGGICSVGSWKEGIRDRFYVRDLENAQQTLLCDHVNSGSDTPFSHFFFKQEGVNFGLKALRKTHCTHPDVLLIDEVGGLELENRGWSPFLDTLHNVPVGVIFMVVRESLVEQVTTRWNLPKGHVIKTADMAPERILPIIRRERMIFNQKNVIPVTGIVLAGGKSSRLGMDKGLVRYRNKSLINIAIERFRALCDTVLISSNSDAYNDLGYPVIKDVVNDCGPMMGIYSCLRKSATPVSLVASVDTPLVPAGLYRELIHIKDDAQVVVPSPGQGKYEPVIGLYEYSVLEQMEKLFARKNYTLPDLYKQICFKGMPVCGNQPFSNPAIFTNINTSADLELLESSDNSPAG